MYYTGIFIPNHKTGVFDVSFVEILGCISQGDYFEDAMYMAQEALTLHVSSMIEDGEVLPTPVDHKDARKIYNDFLEEDGPLPEDTQFHYVFFTPEIPVTEVSARINISIRKKLLEDVDAMAEELYMSRSGFFSAAAKHYVNYWRT